MTAYRATTITLVTGNTSWWKQRKYRREAAAALRQLRAQGWRCTGARRLPQSGIDSRRFTEYRLVLAADASLPAATREQRRG